MKKYFFIICLLTFLSIITDARAEQDWQEIRSAHFILYYKSAPEEFRQRLIQRAEDYYSSIAESLAFNRFDFWLWDDRAKIYVYDNADQYRATGVGPAWSGGAALAKRKVIYTFVGAQDFSETVLPHELAHIIFREFVGMNNPAVPLWLEEGVAYYQESRRNPVNKSLVKEAMARGTFIPLKDLARMNPAYLRQDDKAVGLFYAESATIIEYLIDHFGKDAFVSFCQNLRDNRNLAGALSAAYSLDNIGELDKAWQKYLGR